MLATVSPDNISSNETLSTLRYAQQARNIVNVARINEDPKNRLIRELQAEINRLRNLTLGGLNILHLYIGVDYVCVKNNSILYSKTFSSSI